MMLRLGLLLTTVMLWSGVAQAEDLKSGPQPGQKVKFFLVEKIGGTEADGVKTGKKLCYRCRNMGGPQVIIFTKEQNEAVAKLATGLDELVNENGEGARGKLRGFVNFIGEDREEAAEAAKSFADKNKLKMLPAVVPNEFENGPGDYGLNSKANVTVILAEKGGNVVASHAFESLDEASAKKVVDEVSKKLVK